MEEEEYGDRNEGTRTDETTGAGEKEITAGSDRVVEINVARLIGATEECACGLSGSQSVRSIMLRERTVSLVRVGSVKSGCNFRYFD